MATETRSESFQLFLRNSGFVGPFPLIAKETKDKSGHNGIKLVPADGKIKIEMLASFGSDNLAIIFPVGSFEPKPEIRFTCLARWREGAKVIEAIPATEEIRENLSQAEVWRPKSRPAPQLEFVEKNGRWTARLESGALVIPHGIKITPENRIFEAGQLSIRGAVTRTFLIAGETEVITETTDKEIESIAPFNGEVMDLFSPHRAIEFLIVDPVWTTAWEIFGHVTKPIVEKSATETSWDLSSYASKSKAEMVTSTGLLEYVEKLITKGEDWWKKVFYANLSSDIFLPPILDGPAEVRAQREKERRSHEEAFSASRKEWDRAIEWLLRWTKWAEEEIIAGRKVEIPNPVGREKQLILGRYQALIDLNGKELIELFLSGQVKEKEDQSPAPKEVATKKESSSPQTFEEAQAKVHEQKESALGRMRAKVASATKTPAAKTPKPTKPSPAVKKLEKAPAEEPKTGVVDNGFVDPTAPKITIKQLMEEKARQNLKPKSKRR